MVAVATPIEVAASGVHDSENGANPKPREDFLNLAPIDPAMLTLTAEDLENLSDEEIRARLNAIQEMAVRLRKHVKAVERKTKTVATVGDTVGALLSASNAATRAQFQHNKATEKLNAANTEYANIHAAYLRANKITELSPEVTSQLDAGREAMIARLSGPVARVKRVKRVKATPDAVPASADSPSTESDDSGEDDTDSE